MLRDEIVGIDASETTFLTGDIVDFANAKNSELKNCENLFQHLRKKHGAKYIIGNHERKGTFDEFVVYILPDGRRVLLLHYDLQTNREKYLAYRQKSAGAGWFKRTFIIPFIHEYEEMTDRNLGDDFKNAVLKEALKYNCQIVIGGHRHPKELIREKYQGVDIYVVPRGKTEIYL